MVSPERLAKGFVRNADQRSFFEGFRALSTRVSNSYFIFFYDQRISGRATPSLSELDIGALRGLYFF